MNRKEARAILDRAQTLGLVTDRTSRTHPDLTMRQVWEICNTHVVELGHPKAKLQLRFRRYITENFVRAAHSRRGR